MASAFGYDKRRIYAKFKEFGYLFKSLVVFKTQQTVLELEAYAHLVSALRAQGPLNSDKRKLLKDTSLVLNIPQDRHKAEIRRAVNDEKLNTIAYQ